MPRIRFPLLLGLLLTIAACEDPSNVGIGLIGDTDAQPTIVAVEAKRFEPLQDEDLTGEAARILAGRVEDPLLGTITASGYLDFSTVANRSSAFTAGPVTAVALLLRRDYVYGDTATTVTLRLRDIAADWDPAGAAADTVFAVADEILTFDLAPTDTLVEVPLPEAWVAANDATLRSSSFSADFDGFHLEPVSAQAVVGFDAARTTLRVVSTDTLNFPVSRQSTTAGTTLYKTFTHIERPGNAALPAEHLLLQDGTGRALALDFDLNDPALIGGVINRAVVRLEADTARVLDTPPGFVRPLLRNVVLSAVTSDGLALPLNGTFTLSDTGRLTYSSLDLNGIVQSILLGQGVWSGFQLQAPPRSNTLNALLLYDASLEARAPKAILTFTPANE